jgi:hypothetical protein
MRARIEDRAAIAFASALYGALAYGRSVRDAFDLGVIAIQAIESSGSRPKQQQMPRLFAAAGVDAGLVYLVRDTRRMLGFKFFGASGSSPSARGSGSGGGSTRGSVDRSRLPWMPGCCCLPARLRALASVSRPT